MDFYTWKKCVVLTFHYKCSAYKAEFNRVFLNYFLLFFFFPKMNHLYLKYLNNKIMSHTSVVWNITGTWTRL